MSKVAILGSSGMIGSHLKKLLLYKNIDFIDINRDMWDLSQWKSDEELDILFKNTEAIFNFAGALPTSNNIDENQLIFDVNVRSCFNLAQWATKRNISIIYLSGSTVYENPNKKGILENEKKVVYGLGEFYGYSKLLAENIFQHFIAQGLLMIIMRPSSVYGTGLGETKLINIFLKKATNDEIINISEANNKINFIHAMDVAYASLEAYKKKSYGIFNISGKEMISIEELANICIEVAESGKIEKIEYAKNPFERFNLNCINAEKEFNFKPKINMFDGVSAMNNKVYLENMF